MLALILANVELGEEEKVEKSILEISEVEEAYQVYGLYDIVIKVKFEEKEKLRNIVLRIRAIKGIRSTMTLIIM
ncbi:MAG: Lrp/AsnC family transcriptional regulator [Nitrososphaeria archaeon]|nr:Lrp/AsnC family transcriptional regulator [Nitrososphaeria archaeon]NIN53579.1 Lrp/AsnC family transcriptional regulator [Nitrososphaeria archaeon]NIQ34100.1 Lrp/AsnC family transcriptional regulator [Nitrososphaeria archaeon]